MSFPRYADVDIALLLELVRARRPVKPHETYDFVSKHFPKLTEQDKTAMRKDGRTRVWPNMIHWARDHLRVQNVLEDPGSGLWSVNPDGRGLLARWLTSRGATQVNPFIDSDRLLGDYLGVGWAGELRTRRPREMVPAPIQPVQRTEPATVEIAAIEGSIDLHGLQGRELESVSSELLARLRAMDEYEFENFVGRVLDAMGFRETIVVGRPGDGGVDVKCTLRNALVEATVAVQVKRQQANVGPKDISYLRDRWARKVDKLLFVTTSDYTPGAREVAEEDGLKSVRLVHGRELAALMIDEKIGVSSRVVERLVIDDDFFAG